MAGFLKGVAFITGAGSGSCSPYVSASQVAASQPAGIGQSTAFAFARYGVRQLAICDIHASNLSQTAQELKSRHANIEVLPLQADTSSEDAVDTAISKTVSTFSRLDLAVNNAGIGGHGVSDQLSLDQWRNVMSVNQDGVFLCQRAQIRQMLRQEPFDSGPRGSRGVIVNVASMYGVKATSRATPATAYTTSKHAVMGLTKADGVYFAPKGIRINAICPGYVRTPLLESSSVSVPFASDIGLQSC